MSQTIQQHVHVLATNYLEMKSAVQTSGWRSVAATTNLSRLIAALASHWHLTGVEATLAGAAVTMPALPITSTYLHAKQSLAALQQHRYRFLR